MHTEVNITYPSPLGPSHGHSCSYFGKKVAQITMVILGQQLSLDINRSYGNQAKNKIQILLA